MPAKFLSPGVYVAEVPSGPPTITAVSTSITAFVGAAPRGPETPVAVNNLTEYRRVFGEVSRAVPMSLAVRDFFAHGGSDAVVVRVMRGGVPARVDLGGGTVLAATNAGAWGNALSVEIIDRSDTSGFDLIVRDADEVVEVFSNLTIRSDDRRYVGTVLATSLLVALVGDLPATRPPVNAPIAFTGGSDGEPIGDDDLAGPTATAARSGLYALDHAERFGLLCIPQLAPDRDIARATRDAALRYARTRRAVVVLDAPMEWTTADDALAGLGDFADRADNGALYFPGLVSADPTDGTALRVAAGGAIAGVIARTDATRGVWESPAGTEARLIGMPAIALDDAVNGRLNERGVNCIRAFTGRGTLVWGARTLAGGDDLASEYKYIPVRRLAWLIAESIEQGLGWATFEPSDTTLRQQVESSVSAFMLMLFRTRAFKGSTPRDAFFVQSVQTTKGIDVTIGFAALKPAEFVVLRLTVG